MAQSQDEPTQASPGTVPSPSERPRDPPRSASPGGPEATGPPPPGAPANYPWDRALRWLDRRQQRLGPVAFIGAIVKKAGEDQVSLLAAVMSHYGMLSIFPLLLLLVTVAGYLFHDDLAAQQALIDAALDNFPVLGESLRANVQALPGSGIAIAFGVVLLAWASLGFTKTAQVAIAEIWSIPKRLRPGYWPHLGRSVWALAMLALPTLLTATGTIVTSRYSSVMTTDYPLPGWVQVVVAAAAIVVGVGFFVVVNFGSHLLAFRALTPANVPTRHLLPGTIVFSIFWTGLTVFGSTLVTGRLARANQLYGTIGFVIGLIFWIYLGAYGALLSTELNVVRARHLYPRTLVGPPRTKVDRKALRYRARTEELVPGQVVDVRFDGLDAPPPPPTSADEAASHRVVDAGQRGGPQSG